jgi:hypothetical protein
MWTLLAACELVPEPNDVPERPPEDTDLPVTGVEVIADPPWVLGKVIDGPHADPRLHYVDGKLVATWVAENTVQIADVPILNPSLVTSYELTNSTAAGARPDGGLAEGRLIGVWTTPAGTVTASGIMQGGGAMNTISAGYGVVHGSVRMNLSAEGDADLVWTTGTQVETSGVDRLLGSSEPPVDQAEAVGDAFDAVAAPGGGFFAVWTAAAGLQAGAIPPSTTAPVVLGDALATDPNVAIREDGAWAATWLDGSGTAWFQTSGDPGSAAEAIELATGASTPVIVWVDDRVAIAWTTGAALSMGLYDLDGVLATDTPALALGEASGRPAMASRAVNDAWEITIVWPVPTGEMAGTFANVIDRTLEDTSPLAR